MKKYRWGFAGSGGISQRAVSEIARLEQAEVFAVSSRQQKKADQFASQYGLKRAYDHFEKMCRDPEVDIIYIGTPNVYHKEQAILAMSCAKAVLCEKPLSVSVRDTQEMITAAKNNSVFLMEGLWTRFIPVIRTVKEWIQAGAVGEILRIDASFCSQSALGPDSRVFSRKLGGGALLDLGVYPISVASFLIDRPVKKVSARGIIGSTQVDVDAEVDLEFLGGTVAKIRCSLMQSSGESLSLYGTKGTIEIPFFWRAESAVHSHNSKIVRTVTGKASFEFEAQEVMRSLEQGILESTVMPWAASLQTAQIIEESQRQLSLCR